MRRGGRVVREDEADGEGADVHGWSGRSSRAQESIAKPQLHLASLVQYDDSEACPVIAPPLPVEKTFVRVLGESGKRQLRVSEESRFTHIKILLNGAGDLDVEGDDTVMVHDKSEHSRDSLVGSMDVSVGLCDDE